ncbi:hypothetical protein BC628DRAFT_1180165 [Trametes gibbosa]|nr:hypothetical protein BC628DRAFT_1180165 [Trametes gibbosa]
MGIPEERARPALMGLERPGTSQRTRDCVRSISSGHTPTEPGLCLREHAASGPFIRNSQPCTPGRDVDTISPRPASVPLPRLQCAWARARPSSETSEHV